MLILYNVVGHEVGKWLSGMNPAAVYTMEQPQEAIFVKVIDRSDKSTDKVNQLRKIESNIQAKQVKLQVPQGPAFINGRWWWPPHL